MLCVVGLVAFGFCRRRRSVLYRQAMKRTPEGVFRCSRWFWLRRLEKLAHSTEGGIHRGCPDMTVDNRGHVSVGMPVGMSMVIPVYTPSHLSPTWGRVSFTTEPTQP